MTDTPIEDQRQMTGIDFYGLSGPDLLRYCGQDASKWAEAFCRIKEVQGWSVTDIDEGLMTAWFANAIQHSADLRRSHTNDCRISSEAIPASESVRAFLQKIYDLIDAEDVAEPLDDAIAYAKKALKIMDATGQSQ